MRARHERAQPRGLALALGRGFAAAVGFAGTFFLAAAFTFASRGDAASATGALVTGASDAASFFGATAR